MPEWLKTLVMIIGMGGWLGTVVVSWVKGQMPDAATLGIPAALVIALAPPGSKLWRRRGNEDSAASEEAEQNT